ncbi:transcription factor AP-2-alpha isoform X2 [Astyanax mexicanus]|uniref:transcription factor AP-2-alpha isoform X2 n=1 Tax=Astyanax mexicanus TaxID=7994 RepID=UPI0020CB204D|nr:transcription factor AP-2-alpha isoform X2 [Astyanax mexicanus]
MFLSLQMRRRKNVKRRRVEVPTTTNVEKGSERAQEPQAQVQSSPNLGKGIEQEPVQEPQAQVQSSPNLGKGIEQEPVQEPQAQVQSSPNLGKGIEQEPVQEPQAQVQSSPNLRKGIEQEPVQEPQAQSCIGGDRPVNFLPTEKVFMVESLLKSSNFREKRRYRVSLDEIQRRIGPPEFLSLNGLVSYLRTAKSNKDSLKGELEAAGIIPPPVTRLTSMCSKLTEDEADDLAVDLGKLASRHIDFQSAAETQQSSQDKATDLLKAKEFLGQTKNVLAPFMSRYNTVTHGLGPKTFEVSVQILEAYLRQVIRQLTEES